MAGGYYVTGLVDCRSTAVSGLKASLRHQFVRLVEHLENQPRHHAGRN
jgi:hypothetical protein